MRITSLVLVAALALASTTTESYTKNSLEEIEVFATVLKAEVVANSWTAQEQICLSVGDKDANKKLLSELKKRGLRVCSEAEWRKNWACGFGVHLELARFETSESARVRFSTADYREINQGKGDLAILLRRGEYSLRKAGGLWSVIGYAPDVRVDCKKIYTNCK